MHVWWQETEHRVKLQLPSDEGGSGTAEADLARYAAVYTFPRRASIVISPLCYGDFCKVPDSRPTVPREKHISMRSR